MKFRGVEYVMRQHHITVEILMSTRYQNEKEQEPSSAALPPSFIFPYFPFTLPYC